MKKLLSFVLASALLLTSAGCAGSSSSSSAASEPASEASTASESSAADSSAQAPADGEVITLRLGSNHADNFPTSLACTYMADLVKERTNGKVVIECYFNAVLGDEKSLIEQVQFGSVDIARVNISPMAEFVDDFIALQLPYIYNDTEHFWRVMGGDIGMGILKSDKMKDAGFLGLNYYDGGTRNFYNSKKEIHTPADMAGLNIRVQESSLMMGMVSAMGANPTPMAYGEVYSALQTGVVDGAENSTLQYLAVSHYEVAPYLCLDAHTRCPDLSILSMKTVEKLNAIDPSYVEIIEQAAIESVDYQRELWDEAEKDALDQVIAAGCTVTELTADEIKLFQESVAELNATEGAAYADILDAIAAAA